MDQALHIFVVENHEDTLQSVRDYLEQMGHSVHVARTKAEALTALASTDCDVLLSDIGLPDGTGWELLEEAQLPPDVFAVAISGYGMDGDCERSRLAGFRRHLVKPTDPDELDEVLAEALQERNESRPN